MFRNLEDKEIKLSAWDEVTIALFGEILSAKRLYINNPLKHCGISIIYYLESIILPVIKINSLE
jgi:hypothetical protein